MAASVAIPPTQNTAPVHEHKCLYTHDLRRKQKRWQDGFLKFHTFNKRVMVYDLARNFIGDLHWRETENIQDGDEFELDRGVIVQVAEAMGSSNQDLTALLEKRFKQPDRRPRENESTNSSTITASGVRSMPSHPIPSPGHPRMLRPKPLNVVLGNVNAQIDRSTIGKKSTPNSEARTGSIVNIENRGVKRSRPNTHRGGVAQQGLHQIPTSDKAVIHRQAQKPISLHNVRPSLRQQEQPRSRPEAIVISSPSSSPIHSSQASVILTGHDDGISPLFNSSTMKTSHADQISKDSRRKDPEPLDSHVSTTSHLFSAGETSLKSPDPASNTLVAEGTELPAVKSRLRIAPSRPRSTKLLCANRSINSKSLLTNQSLDKANRTRLKPLHVSIESVTQSDTLDPPPKSQTAMIHKDTLPAPVVLEDFQGAANGHDQSISGDTQDQGVDNHCILDAIPGNIVSNPSNVVPRPKEGVCTNAECLDKLQPGEDIRKGGGVTDLERPKSPFISSLSSHGKANEQLTRQNDAARTCHDVLSSAELQHLDDLTHDDVPDLRSNIAADQQAAPTSHDSTGDEDADIFLPIQSGENLSKPDQNMTDGAAESGRENSHSPRSNSTGDRPLIEKNTEIASAAAGSLLTNESVNGNVERTDPTPLSIPLAVGARAVGQGQSASSTNVRRIGAPPAPAARNLPSFKPPRRRTPDPPDSASDPVSAPSISARAEASPSTIVKKNLMPRISGAETINQEGHASLHRQESDQSTEPWGIEAWDLFGCGRDGIMLSFEEFLEQNG